MIKNNLIISLTSLRSNLLRSFLTMSGIIIGIAAVIVVLSIGRGHEKNIENQIQQMGSNLFWINVLHFPFPAGIYNVNTSNPNIDNSYSDKQNNFIQNYITEDDAFTIRKKCTAVEWCAPVFNSFANGKIDGKEFQVNIIITTPEYLNIKSLNLLSGRFLSYEDIKKFNNICVIEESSNLKLSSLKSKHVYLNSEKYKIIGIVSQAGFPFGAQNIATIYIPLASSQNTFSGSKTVQTIYCTAKENLLETAKKQVSDVLNSRNLGKLNYEIRSTRDLLNRAETLTKTATLITSGIGMISLFVGGIGIMNILLASVYERIREIGIFRSVGARKRDILLQFLFESIIFSLSGGIIGIIAGFFTSKLLNILLYLPVDFSIESIIAGIIFSCITGLIFGIYPACKAANLNPIESLRYE